MQGTSAAILPKPFEITPVTNIEAKKHEVRFFVQMGWTTLDVDTQAIPNKQLKRGMMMPCTSYQQKDHKNLIIERDRIPNSESADRDGKVIYARYWRYAYDEAE